MRTIGYDDTETPDVEIRGEVAETNERTINKSTLDT